MRELLYNRSGPLGVSGISSDMRVLLESDEPAAEDPIDIFVYRIGGQRGSLATALGGVDTIVFTAGIGEDADPVRERVCRDARWLGVELDPARGPRISTADSRVTAWVVSTDEKRMIALHTRRVLAGAADGEGA